MTKIGYPIRIFAPECWGQVDRFQCFWPSTYAFNKRDQRAVKGVEAHFIKYQRLMALAGKLRPNLQIDREQLDERGFTPADNAAELATVIEAAILELYSSIDCTVKVLRANYGKDTRNFKDSTRGLFENIGKLTGKFPDELKPLFADAKWFRRLLHLRDELTHLAPGSVYPNHNAGTVCYYHYGLCANDKPLKIEDIFGWLDEMMGHVNIFLDAVFRYLNSTLADKPVFQVCGMVEGRVLYRYLSPVGEITFHSGACGAWTWFELPDNPTCPFKDNCGAYLNKASPQGLETNVPCAVEDPGDSDALDEV